MLGRSEIINFFLIIQICASAFQLPCSPPKIGKNAHHVTNGAIPHYRNSKILQSMVKDPNYNDGEESDSQDIEDSHQPLNRRNLLLSLGAALATTSAGIYATNEAAEASSTSGYIPDMAGGFKKPKGVGGLSKKIRTYGDIMVSGMYV